MTNRTTALTIFIALAAACGACDRRDADARNAGERLDSETNALARKSGKAAHELADEARIAAKKAEKKLAEAGHEAKTGWEEAKKPSASK